MTHGQHHAGSHLYDHIQVQCEPAVAEYIDAYSGASVEKCTPRNNGGIITTTIQKHGPGTVYMNVSALLLL